ncbi:MAG: DUF4912 domain-containing protein [Candidatus Eisenbacteria bacterium]|nr:DUF4912 domain-containing protein [Candidatus Eisenbacteria bacterium]
MRGKKTEAGKQKTESRAGARRRTARSEPGIGVTPGTAGNEAGQRKAPEKPRARGSVGKAPRTVVRKVAAKKRGAESRRKKLPTVGRRGGRELPAGFAGTTPASRAETAVRPEMLRVTEEARALAERPSDRGAFPEARELPSGYGKDHIVAMVRDPYWIHAYWELTQETVAKALRSFGRQAPGAKRILRVYSHDAKSDRQGDPLFDVALTADARNWYINVGGPGRVYRVEIGLLTRAGKYVCLASSNSVRTPPDRMSDLLDEEWADLTPEYYAEMYALSGGLTGSRAPLTSPGLAERLARRLEQRLASPVFSPGVSAGIGARELERPFWLRLDADLVVYGATVPGSHLEVEGGTCSLREDGTFSFRSHLPDGKKEIKVTSRSEDGTRQETIRLTVTRSTE